MLYVGLMHGWRRLREEAGNEHDSQMRVDAQGNDIEGSGRNPLPFSRYPTWIMGVNKPPELPGKTQKAKMKLTKHVSRTSKRAAQAVLYVTMVSGLKVANWSSKKYSADMKESVNGKIDAALAAANASRERARAAWQSAADATSAMPEGGAEQMGGA